MCFLKYLYKLTYSAIFHYFFQAESLYRLFNSDLFAVKISSAWDSAIPVRWASPTREILLFLSGGTLLRVGFCYSWAMEHSRAWDPAIPERWTNPARENPRFLSGGHFLRVGFCSSWAVDCSRA